MRLRSLFLCVLLLGAWAAWAGERTDVPVIGYVKTVSGTALVSTDTMRIAARPGTPVYLGSRLSTGPHSSLGVTFKDETVMSFGPDTELVVDAYLFAPAQGQLQLVASLLRGSLNYVSGLIARLQPDAVTVKTPTGIIGVRGTQFVAKVDDGAQ
jgi:hypothetical protein